MNERKILVWGLSVVLIALAVVFTLLFIYVDMRWWDLKSATINPVHTVIATAAMLLVGVSVYITRNRKR